MPIPWGHDQPRCVVYPVPVSVHVYQTVLLTKPAVFSNVNSSRICTRQKWGRDLTKSCLFCQYVTIIAAFRVRNHSQATFSQLCIHYTLSRPNLISSKLLSQHLAVLDEFLITSLVWLSCSGPDQHACECRYAKLERGLGEVDRARAIYVHASAMADPRRDTGFWADWNAFEVHPFC